MKNIFPDIDKSKLDDFYINIGRNVKNIRKEKNYSQLELAISIGQKSTSFLSNCENYKNKKVNRINCQRNSIKYAWVKEHQKSFSITLICKILKLNRSGYYHWLKKGCIINKVG